VPRSIMDSRHVDKADPATGDGPRIAEHCLMEAAQKGTGLLGVCAAVGDVGVAGGREGASLPAREAHEACVHREA